ncbi:MAG: hypothetical protein AAGE05_06740 [Pseudomonadota bacterium]
MTDSDDRQDQPSGETHDPRLAYRRPLTLLPLLTIALFISIIIVAIVR